MSQDSRSFKILFFFQTGFLWPCSRMGKGCVCVPHCYCKVKAEVQVSYLTSIDNKEELLVTSMWLCVLVAQLSSLTLWGWGVLYQIATSSDGSVSSLLGLLWHHLVGVLSDSLQYHKGENWGSHHDFADMGEGMAMLFLCVFGWVEWLLSKILCLAKLVFYLSFG